jgi:hypothetical protein
MSASPAGRKEYTNSVVRWIEYRLPVFSVANEFMGTDYPAPRNLNYWWNFGSLAVIVRQKIEGIHVGGTAGLHRWPDRADVISQMRRAAGGDAGEDANLAHR